METCKECGIALSVASGRKPHLLIVQLDQLYLGGEYCLKCFGRLGEQISELLAVKDGKP